ncbi:xanthine dehydrogenase [Skermanella stibiiresistens SB22]|uniref:Xanthine dehydrogenase n=1 Tax=Skermanella stibiiresistens SB22 TaxID=1385369 RepID=W9H0Q9_9PROT|nr:xanthine dehydrogenase family protein molybdopterin-binding subunit [Skermanella stibiiresistens]EWY38426.1 xanthine dehydrogenase [Skermanella stibiiresistens SB22]
MAVGLVGTSVRRIEDHRLLTGKACYVADIVLPQMLHMAVVRSTRAHAEIVEIRVDKALAYPGVRLVLTGEDVRHLGPLPCIDLFPDSKPALHRVLALDKVRYVGEPIAVVIADDGYAVEDAAELVEVVYRDLPVVLDLGEAASEAPPALLYPEFDTNVANVCRQEVGDPDAAFTDAAHVFEETFRIHRYAAAPMETRGVVADPTGQGGRITLHTSTQFPHLVRAFLGGVLGIPESDIRVVAPDVGGGFGAKCEFYPEEVISVVAARRLGRPVRWIEGRQEHFVATTHAREQIHTMRAAVDADGIVTAVTLRSLTSNGAAMFTLATTPASISSAMLRGPYRIPNYRAESLSVLTNKTPLAVYRGAGHPQAVLCMELMMDRIARDLGIDRIDLRRRNMLTKGELPSDRGTAIVLAGKVVYDTGDYPGCLDQVLELAGWDDRLRRQAEARGEGRIVGLGVACFVEETAIGPYETGHVRVDGSGKVTVLTGASPHGQGTATAIAQLVAEELQIPIADVTVRHGDTDVVADGVGTFASRGGAIAGAAARLAAHKVREKAVLIASELLEAAAVDVAWVDGRAEIVGVPGRGVTLAEIARRATAWNSLPAGLSSFNLDEVAHHQVPGIAFANAAHVVEVEIDRDTGTVRVLDYAVVHDSGRIINPMIVEGQVHGGIAQGLGGLLMEEIAYDATGRPLVSGFQDYFLPTSAEMPDIRTGFMESPTPLNPYGMKGAGEGGTTGAVGAITGAIADALAPLGIRVAGDGPFTPPAVMALLRARGEGVGA